MEANRYGITNTRSYIRGFKIIKLYFYILKNGLIFVSQIKHNTITDILFSISFTN